MTKRGAGRKTAAAFLLLGSVISSPAFAASWAADADDAQNRSDIEILAAAGVIDNITTSYPLAWGSVLERLQNSANLSGQPQSITDAAARVLAKAQADTAPKDFTASLELDASSSPATVRGFDALGRQAVQGQGILDWSNDSGTSLHLAVGSRTDSRTDRQTLVFDGSYAAQQIGGAVVYAGYVPHWWGPGWETALSLSTNARPFPSIGITRAGTQAFNTPWLSWLGPWQAEFFVGVLDGQRIASNTLFNGVRVSINPLPGLEIALDRTEQSCGTGHPCQPVAEFFNVNNDPVHQSKSKDETNLDLRYSDTLLGVPYAAYTQLMDRDTGPFTHSDSSHLFGASVWLPMSLFGGDDTPLRLTAEYANTISTLNIFSFGNYLYGATYTDFKYTDGWQYRGLTMGSSVGTDSRLATVEASFLGGHGITYTLTYNHADIGAPQSTGFNIVSAFPVALNVGELKLSFPVANFHVDITGRYQDGQAFPDHGNLLAVETRIRMAL